MRNLVNNLLRNQNLITDGAMLALGQAGLLAGSCDSGIDHGGVGFLFQGFSFNRCGLRTGFILENLAADRAGVVSVVALCRAGGLLGVGLGHRVMCLDNGIVQGGFVGAVLVGEILVAYAAIPVGGIAVLGAGGSLGFGLGHRVTRGCKLFSLHGGYGLAVGILKCLAASGAGVILVVAVLGAGGGLGFGLGQGVRNLVNDFLRNQDLITDGAMRALGQTGLFAGGCNSGIDHGGVGFLFQGLSGNRCGLRSGFILENPTADRAGVVSVVALCCAGGFLGVGLGQRVMCLDNGLGQGGFVGAVLVGEILVAYAAIPVGGIAVLGAGGSLGFGLGHRVTRGCKLFSLHGGYGLAVGILKCLAAGGAGIILVVAILGAGGGLGFGLGHRVTRGRNLFSLHGGCGLAVGILKNLTAGRAGIIRIVAVLGAGGSLSVGLGHRVTAGSKNFVFKGGLLRTLGILKNLTANRAGIIRIVAVLSAGRFLGVGLGQAMPSRNYPAVFGNFILARFIGEILAAGSAGPVGAAADFGAGGSFSFGFDQCMCCRNHPTIFGNFVVTFLIGEELAAVGAAPVCAVTGLCTCSSLCIGFCQFVPNRNAAVAYLEVNIGFFKIKNIIRIIGD